jgi:hypothetical protein
MCFEQEIQIFSAVFKGELILTLVSFVGLTISSSEFVVSYMIYLCTLHYAPPANEANNADLGGKWDLLVFGCARSERIAV